MSDHSATALSSAPPPLSANPAALPKLGFVGTGWIGRLRMQALLETQCAEFCFVHDPCSEAAAAAASLTPGITVSHSIDELVNEDLDGLVIATPSALHADHCKQALAHNKAVFCQKPLARTRNETTEVVAAARAADRRLAVDFSYRHLAGANLLKEIIAAGELGEVFAADLTFHNAYGPDKPWFYDVESAGGGCVMDLGIHLVDLAMWLLGNDEVDALSSTLFQHGQKLRPPYAVVEDYAEASFALANTQVRLCCSWNLHAGQDAIIEAKFYGTNGGAAIHNINGSFFDFEVYQFNGTAKHTIGHYPDAWGGRALTQWVEGLAQNPRFDPQVQQAIQVAEAIDRIYQR